ncbi:hypothetical protein ACWC7P_46070, partial [Streptomyces sp. NPDC001275]
KHYLAVADESASAPARCCWRVERTPMIGATRPKPPLHEARSGRFNPSAQHLIIWVLFLLVGEFFGSVEAAWSIRRHPQLALPLPEHTNGIGESPRPAGILREGDLATIASRSRRSGPAPFVS